MKKMNAILAAITLAVTALTPLASSAMDLPLTKGKDTMTVSKTYDASYELEIPDTYTLAQGEGFNVTATGFLHVNEKMIISVESDNDWNIVDTSCDTNQIKYDVSVDGKKIEEKKADIFEVAYNDEGQTKTVTMNIDKIYDPTYAGTYTDKLTFSARAVDIPEKDGEEEKVTTATEAPATTTTASETETAPATTTTETTPIVNGDGDNEA